MRERLIGANLQACQANNRAEGHVGKHEENFLKPATRSNN
jgi:hypothetical protein